YQRDVESGLDYAMDRYDANSYGRFTSPDKGSMHPQLPRTLNRYIYGGDDPINHMDASGKDWMDDPNAQSDIWYLWYSGGVACFGNCTNENFYPPGWDAFTAAGLLAEYGAWLGHQSAAGAANLANANTPASQINPGCVQNAITSAAASSGVDLMGFNVKTVQIAGQGYSQTELVLNGGDVDGLI